MNATPTPNNHLKRALTIVAVIGVVVTIIATIVGWIIIAGGYLGDRGAEKQRAKQHNTDMIEMKDKLKAVEEWQRDWPSTGKLALDDVQNNRLDEHDRRIDKLEEK